MNILRAVARPLLAAPFVVSGIDALVRPSGHRERAKLFTPLLERAGIELSDRAVDRSARLLGLTTIVSGTCLASGKLPRISAGVLAGVQVPISLANNPVWSKRGSERMEAVSSLIVQGAILGGLLVASVDRVGKPSLSWRHANAKAQRAEIREISTALENKYSLRLTQRESHA